MKDEPPLLAATEPHPLDDFEFGKPDPAENSRVQVHKPLLRWSVIVAAAAFGVIFVSSVMGNNAAFNSGLQRTCTVISGASAMVMLAACAGILFAYRLPHIDIYRLKSGAISAKGWFANGLATLALLNLLLIIGIWAGAFLLGSTLGWLYALGISFMGICFGGIAATMVVTHTGYLRGYAIGVLTVLTPLLISSLSPAFLMIPMMSGGMRYSGAVPMLGSTIFTLAGASTLSCFVGMICACYVALVEKIRSPNPDRDASKK